MAFSGAVRISDVNDYIAPSQSCVVSLKGQRIQETSEVQLHAPKSGPAAPIPTDPVKVSLHDCLACSGCITSAETVLLQHQSSQELREKLWDPDVTVIVSVSPQSRAALAASYGLTPAETAGKLTTWLKGLGVRRVFGIETGRDLALLETAAEFITRHRARAAGAAASGPLPMLASACPGWVCYAEKTHGDVVLPYISSAKSPQAVMGTLVKRMLCANWGIDPGKVYHCTVMPCYDKKLEASREEFNVPGTNVAEVDSCLATTEVRSMLDETGIDFASLAESPMDTLLGAVGGGGLNGGLYGLPGGSGGYMEFVFRSAARELFGRDLPPGRLPTKTIRNQDFQELILEDGAGGVLMRFASMYGFRNIQTLMRKIKTGRCEYDYVEVMACPMGCLNGGGQPKPSLGESVEKLIERLEGVYHHSDVTPRQPTENPEVRALYVGELGNEVGSEVARKLLHTTYRRRAKTVTSTLSDW